MSRETPPNRDSHGHLGPWQGNSILFTGVTAGSEWREADRRKAEESERKYD